MYNQLHPSLPRIDYEFKSIGTYFSKCIKENELQPNSRFFQIAERTKMIRGIVLCSLLLTSVLTDSIFDGGVLPNSYKNCQNLLNRYSQVIELLNKIGSYSCSGNKIASYEQECKSL